MLVAVTGASGFIGQHVLAELKGRGVDVVAVTRTVARLANAGAGIRTVQMDIAEADVHSYDCLGRPDVLIHLAWDGLPNYKSLHHYEVELPQQYRFLKNLMESGLPALLVAGTCFEYGMQSGALSENHSTAPTNPYGYAKDALRRQLEFLRAIHPVALTWTRLFYVYGEGQAKSSLLPQLQEAIARGDKVFNMSGGEQLRDYLPIGEAARLLVDLALRCRDYAVVNVCSGEPISVRRLVEGWLKQNAWDITLNFGHYPYPDYESMGFWGDRRRMNAILERER
jgi:dTDP-6-deoxy-L-talose 4-dehydrogenase (NAD+)